MSELNNRVLIALLLGPLVIFLVWHKNSNFFYFFLAIILGIVWWEISSMGGIKIPPLLTLIGLIIFEINLYLFYTKKFDLIPFLWALAGLVILISLIVSSFPDRGKEILGKFFSGFLFLGFLYPFLLLLKVTDVNYALMALLFTWSFDSGSYFLGKAWGKNRLLTQVSPKKSWEGLFGGLIFVLLVSLLASYLFKLNYLNTALLAIMTAPLAALGDLSESFIKRTYKIKDSSNLLPGHGGFFDRIDSLVFVFTGFYFFLFFFKGILM